MKRIGIGLWIAAVVGLWACGKQTAEPPPIPEPVLPGGAPPIAPDEPAEPATPTAASPDDVMALSTEGLEGKQWTIGMSQCNRNEPWRVQMDADLEAAAAKYPANIELILKDAQNNVATQQAQVREFVVQDVDLIIVSPKESRPMTAPVAEAMDAGIPVIILDRAIEGDNYTCFIGSDNVHIGREAGKHLVELLGGQGKVVELMGLQTSPPGEDRHNGFMEGIEGSEIEVVFSADCEWLEEKAQKEMQSALAVNEQIDAVYGHNDPSAHGAWLAAKQEGKGREQTIKFIGIDALPHEGVKYVEDGILDATFQYPTCGELAIEAAIRCLLGQELPKNVTLGTVLFTPANVADGGEVIPIG